LEVRRIRSGASRDRHGDVVWLDFMAPHRHLVDDVTVTRARTNTNVPRISARLPLLGSLALGSQHVNLRTSALFGTLSVQMIHDYYPFAMEDGGGWRRWRLSWLIAWLFWWMFVASLTWVLLTLAPCALTVMYVCNISFVDLLKFLFGVLGGCAT
jgi:hypothetical protein